MAMRSVSQHSVTMLLWIAIVGGLTLMMGQHARSESLFYYFRLEDQVPEDHLLRLVDKHIDFGFVRERLKDSYSETGRPSIDPELLLRILLIGYLYGVSSERRLVEELRMHLAWRWFTGLGFDQEVPHPSTFSKNRHGRFQESTVFEQLFEEVVAQCLAVGLVRGDKLSVDRTFVEANASKESRIPREQLAEAAQVNRTVREYLTELEMQNPVEEPTHSQDKVSTTDPDSTYATKGGTPARMPTRDAVGRTRSPFYGPESFTYLPDSNSYICPAGQQLNYGGRNEGNRTFGYIGTRKKCGPCQQRSQCTTGPFRYLAIHMNEAARQRARDLWTTPEFKYAQRQRKKVEALFAELKSHSHIGLHRLRLRRLKFVREQFFLAATAQNIKRLVRFLSRPTMSLIPATS
jgi:transposase